MRYDSLCFFNIWCWNNWLVYVNLMYMCCWYLAKKEYKRVKWHFVFDQICLLLSLFSVRALNINFTTSKDRWKLEHNSFSIDKVQFFLSCFWKWHSFYSITIPTECTKVSKIILYRWLNAWSPYLGKLVLDITYKSL